MEEYYAHRDSQADGMKCFVPFFLVYDGQVLTEDEV